MAYRVKLSKTYSAYYPATQERLITPAPEAVVDSLDAALAFARQYEAGARIINGALWVGNPAAPLFSCNDAQRIGEIHPLDD